jgi:inner membrane protein
MPTAFTHALVGGALAQAAPSGPARWKVIALMAGMAVVPDLDVIAFGLGIPYEHVLGHRGFFHSLTFAALTSLAACLLLFRDPVRFSGKWWLLFGMVTLAGASHGLLDTLTDAGLGIGLFIPFENSRYFMPFRPVETSSVDPVSFFTGRPWEILRSEIIWIWLPVIGFSVLYQLGRLVRR